MRPILCDHIANLGHIDRLLDEQVRLPVPALSRCLTNTSVWPWQTLVTSHGIKAMLKYMHLLSQSSIACDKFARASRGVKVIRELMDESGYRKDCMDVARKMLEGARPSSRTEMVMQLEEAGIIPAIFEHLKDKKEPVPMKVAAVELIKAMQADEDEATSDAVKTAVDCPVRELGVSRTHDSWNPPIHSDGSFPERCDNAIPVASQGSDGDIWCPGHGAAGWMAVGGQSRARPARTAKTRFSMGTPFSRSSACFFLNRAL